MEHEYRNDDTAGKNRREPVDFVATATIPGNGCSLTIQTVVSRHGAVALRGLRRWNVLMENLPTNPHLEERTSSSVPRANCVSRTCGDEWAALLLAHTSIASFGCSPLGMNRCSRARGDEPLFDGTTFRLKHCSPHLRGWPGGIATGAASMTCVPRTCGDEPPVAPATAAEDAFRPYDPPAGINRLRRH